MASTNDKKPPSSEPKKATSAPATQNVPTGMKEVRPGIYVATKSNSVFLTKPVDVTGK